MAQKWQLEVMAHMDNNAVKAKKAGKHLQKAIRKLRKIEKKYAKVRETLIEVDDLLTAHTLDVIDGAGMTDPQAYAALMGAVEPLQAVLEPLRAFAPGEWARSLTDAAGRRLAVIGQPLPQEKRQSPSSGQNPGVWCGLCRAPIAASAAEGT